MYPNHMKDRAPNLPAKSFITNFLAWEPIFLRSEPAFLYKSLLPCKFSAKTVHGASQTSKIRHFTRFFTHFCDPDSLKMKFRWRNSISDFFLRMCTTDLTPVVLLKSEHHLQLETVLTACRVSYTKTVVRYMTWWHVKQYRRRYRKALRQVDLLIPDMPNACMRM